MKPRPLHFDSIRRFSVASLAFGLMAGAASGTARAQAAGNELAARLQAIESAIARLDTQLGLRTTPEQGSFPATDRSIETERRIDALERQVAELTSLLGRLEREIDSVRREAAAATREAAAATRQAAAAERAARDAAIR